MALVVFDSKLEAFFYQYVHKVGVFLLNLVNKLTQI